MGLTIGKTVAVRESALRSDLIREEADETCKALSRGDLVEVADGLCDLVYVSLGTAVACGFDLAPLFREVHRTNMAKRPGLKNAAGKLMKPAGWKPPEIATLLRRQGWGK
jgi:predicted HAD superfamily Cof-like phosphohydrolase